MYVLENIYYVVYHTNDNMAIFLAKLYWFININILTSIIVIAFSTFLVFFLFLHFSRKLSIKSFFTSLILACLITPFILTKLAQYSNENSLNKYYDDAFNYKKEHGEFKNYDDFVKNKVGTFKFFFSE